MASLDLTGRRFGKLVAREPAGTDGHGAKIWLCDCDCGKTHRAVAQNLNSGKVRSCGCLQAKPVVYRGKKMSRRKAAKAAGVSVSNVIAHAQKGQPMEFARSPQMVAMRRIMARAAKDAGYPQADIARALGVSNAAVSTYLRKE